MRTYQEVSAQVIERYERYIAQYLGDGLLVYFDYPAAHEDDAARSIRAGLAIITALDQARSRFPQPVQVRIGIHTGPVVVGQMGGGSRHEQLAMGETPNIASRVQSQAEPDEVVISATTQRLVAGLFEIEDRGVHDLKGISTPQPLYLVASESVAHNRFEVAVQAGLTPLVGRDHELGVLSERWTQAQAGNGQAVLVSGEPGIGKSRLVQELKAYVVQAGATQIEFRCSPYHQNSALYPITEHLQRLLRFAPGDTPETKLAKLQQLLERYRFPQADTLPLFAALLSLRHTDGIPPLTASPQRQKEQTQTALVAWLIEESEQQPVYTLWEDLHWADPSTLEVLALLLNQVPMTRLLAILTFRPEFVPSWGTHSYLSQLTLNRLGHPQASVMVERVTGGKPLPEEVVQQIATKTDGVPLFVEELTKMVVESDFVRQVNGCYELTGPLPPLAIPSTLQDSLMARLDRLGAAREVAQLGATIGREFSYELINVISSRDEPALQHGLQELVDAELIYQRGLPPQARYVFKHALIQDTAYASLLKSRRQHLHQQIAEVLEQQFTETTATQPELVAHHYTEAGSIEQAIPYWQRAGERAVERSAHVEAIIHFTQELELLTTLPHTPERVQQELTLQIALGSSFMVTKGYGTPERERAYARARILCQQVGETPQLFSVLFGLWQFYRVRGQSQPALELAEQLMGLASNLQVPSLTLMAHHAMGWDLLCSGRFASAREHLEQGIALYNPQQDNPHISGVSQDPGVCFLVRTAWTLWSLGYPDQALARSREGLALAQELSHPFSLTFALSNVTVHHQLRREAWITHERAAALIALCREHGFSYNLEWGMVLQGWALAQQGEEEKGIAQLCQSFEAFRATGAEALRSHFLALLAEAYATGGQVAEGLRTLTEALDAVHTTGERYYESELYRLRGELLLNDERRMMNDERRTLKANPAQYTAEGEACFHNALKVARQQEAKSWELRAATSLARLWQQQGKRVEARDLLAPVYDWFGEGFDTQDLKDAKTLLDAFREE